MLCLGSWLSQKAVEKADFNQEEHKTSKQNEGLKIESSIIKKVNDSEKLQWDEKLPISRSLVQIKLVYGN